MATSSSALVIVILCVGMVAFAPHVTAITCRELKAAMDPCMTFLRLRGQNLPWLGYLEQLGKYKHQCCVNIKQKVLTSNPKDVCNCFKDWTYHTVSGEVREAFTECRVKHSFPIRPNANCSDTKW